MGCMSHRAARDQNKGQLGLGGQTQAKPVLAVLPNGSLSPGMSSEWRQKIIKLPFGEQLNEPIIGVSYNPAHFN